MFDQPHFSTAIVRKADVTQHSLYSYRSLEERIPDAHPLRKLRVLVDAILFNMNDDFQALYSRRGRPSIAPERLLVGADEILTHSADYA